MPTAAWVALAGVLGAALAALATWAAARRQRSGSVDTSEAKDLWDESKAIREELRAELASMRVRLAETETKLAENKAELADTKLKLFNTHNQAVALREEVLELRRLCGKTNEDVEAVHAELRVIKSETDEAATARQEAEGQ